MFKDLKKIYKILKSIIILNCYPNFTLLQPHPNSPFVIFPLFVFKITQLIAPKYVTLVLLFQLLFNLLSKSLIFTQKFWVNITHFIKSFVLIFHKELKFSTLFSLFLYFSYYKGFFFFFNRPFFNDRYICCQDGSYNGYNLNIYNDLVVLLEILNSASVLYICTLGRLILVPR